MCEKEKSFNASLSNNGPGGSWAQGKPNLAWNLFTIAKNMCLRWANEVTNKDINTLGSFHNFLMKILHSKIILMWGESMLFHISPLLERDYHFSSRGICSTFISPTRCATDSYKINDCTMFNQYCSISNH